MACGLALGTPSQPIQPASRKEGLPGPPFALVRRIEHRAQGARSCDKRCRPMLQVSSRHFGLAGCFTSGLMPRSLAIAEVPAAQPSDQAKWQSTCGGQFLQQRPTQLQQQNVTFGNHKSGPTQAGSNASTSESRTCFHGTINSIWHFGAQQGAQLNGIGTLRTASTQVMRILWTPANEI